MNTRFVPLLAAAAAALLAACGGGSHAVVPIGSSSANAPRAPQAASIVIHIPRSAATASAAKRSVKYVSPASESASIAIAPAQGCTQCSQAQTLQVSLQGSFDCANGATGRTCTIALNLLPGTYTASLTVYDDVLLNGQATGKPLSANTSFPISVVPQQANVTTVTLDGIPTSIVPTVLTPNAMVIDTIHTGSPVYRLIGPAASAQFSLVAKDADGDIIAGPGAPTWSAVVSGNGFAGAISGNTVSLTAPSTVTRQTGTLAINAVSPGCSDSTARCGISALVGFSETLAVVDHGFPRVDVLTIGAPSPMATITVPAGPSAVAFAPNGTMFVANSLVNSVTVYAWPYTGAPTTLTSGITDPVSLAVDGNGNLAIANGTSGVVIYPPPYAIPSLVIPATNPVAVLTDGANRLYVLAGGNNPGVLTSYNAPYNGSPLVNVTITGSNGVAGMALDAQGRLYVADSGHNDILRLDPPFATGNPALTIASTAQQPLTNPQSVAIAPDGTIFCNGGKTVNIDTAAGAPLGTSALFATTATPNAMAVDGNGTVWVASDPVVGYTQPYAATAYTEPSESPFLTPNALAVWP